MAEHSTAEPRILPTRSRPIINPSEFRPSTSVNEASREAGQDWAPHRNLLKKKYLDEGLTTKDVQLFMSDTHNFHRSVQQYERIFRKWNFRKNNKRKDYEAISSKLCEIRLDEENTEIMINGSFVAFRKLKRQFSRHITPTLASKWPQVTTRRMEKESSSMCHTEQPTECNDIITRSVLASGKQVCFATNLPWFHLLDVLAESYSECLKPCRYMTDNLSSQAVLISSNYYETVLFNKFDKRHWANQILLTAIWRGFSNNFSTDGWTAGLRPCNLSPTQLTRSLLCLESQIPHRSFDDFNDSIGTIVGGYVPTNALIAMSYVIYLISNDLCDHVMQGECAQLLSTSNALPFVKSLAASGSLTAKAVLIMLLKVACDTMNKNLMTLLVTGRHAIDVNIELDHSQDRVRKVIGGVVRFISSRVRRTPLQIMVSNSVDDEDETQARLECTEILLSAGARLEICNSHLNQHQISAEVVHCCWDHSPLQIAMRSGKSSGLVRFLLNRGAYVCQCLNITTMIDSDVNVEIDVIRILLERGASPGYVRRNRAEEEILGERGCWFPLQAAMAQGRLDIAALLLKYRANVNEFSRLRHEIEGWLSAYVTDLIEYFPDDTTSIRDVACQREWRSPLTLCLSHDAKMAGELMDYDVLVNDCHYEWIVEWRGWATTNDVDYWSSSSLPWINGTTWLEPDDILRPRLHPFQTPLEAAVSSESLTMVKAILERGAKPDSQYSESAVAVGARIGRLDMVKLLLDAGAQIDATCPLQYFDQRTRLRHSGEDILPILSPLAEASARGHVEVMTELIDKGANINYCCGDCGVTPLHAAAICGSYCSINLLLAHQTIELSCSETRFCNTGAFAEIAWFEVNQLSIRYLDHKKRLEKSSLILSSEICVRDTTDFGSCLRAQQEHDLRAIDNDPPSSAILHVSPHLKMHLAKVLSLQNLADLFFIRAVQSDNHQVAQSILQQSFKIRLETTEYLLLEWFERWRRGPVTLQEHRRMLDHVELLLASQNWSSIEERVVETLELMYEMLSLTNMLKIKSEAISRMHEVARDLLFCHTGDVIDQHSTLSKILIDAIDIGDLESVLMLSKYNINAELDGDKQEYETALHAACASGHLNIVKSLISAGATINRAVSGLGASPLVLACLHGYADIVTELVTHGANVNQMASTCRAAYPATPLQVACRRGYLDIVIILINHDADVNAPANKDYGMTALQAAVISGHFKIMQILIGAGAKVAAAAAPCPGLTAIDGAAEEGRLDFVKFLLDRYDGDEPISAVCQRATGYARKSGFTVVVELLKSYPGANSDEWADESTWDTDLGADSSVSVGPGQPDLFHEWASESKMSDDDFFEFINEDMVL